MFATALAFSMMAQDVVPLYRRGASLYTNCLSTEREQEGQKDAETVDASSHCIDYVKGFLDAMSTFDNGCFPKNATLGTVVRVYVAYMKAHPKMMDDERPTGLVMAIADAYPCPKK